jgi:hypothetical protein
MVNIEMTVDVLGVDKVLAMKSKITVPLSSVKSIQHDPDFKMTLLAFKEMGTEIPGLVRMGTFFAGGKKYFWDVTDKSKVVTISLENERYDELIIDVENPEETVERLLKEGAV